MKQPVLRLADAPDVLSIKEVCAVLQISDRQYRRLKQHGGWPIPELPQLPRRFSKVQVQRYLDTGGVTKLRRVS